MLTTRFRARGLLCACLVLLLAAPTSAQQPADKTQEILKVFGRITTLDPLDNAHRRGHYKVHTCALTAGTSYAIDLVSNRSFAVSLRLEDSTGNVLDQTARPGPHEDVTRLIYVADRTDTFRLIVATAYRGDTARYFLRVQSFPPNSPPPYPESWVTLATSRPLRFGDITIQQLPRLPRALTGRLTAGYEEYRFKVSNTSTTDSHRVKLTLPFRERGRSGGGPYLRHLTGSVTVRPAAKEEISLWQPPLPFFGWGEGVAPVEVGVEIDGKTQQETLSAFVLNTGSRYRDHGKGEDVDPRHLVNILCSPGLGGALKENTFKADAGPDLRHFHEARLPVEGWSKDWLTYSRYNGLVVAGGEVEIAAAEVRSALFEYTQCGGVLMVVGPCKSLPPSWQRAKTQLQGLTAYFAGFGMCLVSEQGGVTDWGPGQARVLTSAWGQSGDPWRQPRSPSEANRDFPVVENIAVPVRGLFLSMVGFVLIIGPLNLYILGRKKRKLWMLWTVPAFSLATCAAVVLYMIASEGWHGHIRAEGLTFLDEESGRASTVGWIGFYTPMASGDGLRFSRVTELTPQLESPQRYGYYGDRSATSGRSIDWTDEQHLGAGWVTARVPLHFLLRKSEARKERLAVHKEGGALAVTNELGAGIRELWLADAQGRVYTGKDIALGGRSELTPAEKKLAGVNLSSLRQTYTANWLKAFEHDPLTYLRPGCYVAVLNSAPFIEDGLRTYQSRKGRSIVFGIMKEPGHAG